MRLQSNLSYQTTVMKGHSQTCLMKPLWWEATLNPVLSNYCDKRPHSNLSYAATVMRGHSKTCLIKLLWWEATVKPVLCHCDVRPYLNLSYQTMWLRPALWWGHMYKQIGLIMLLWWKATINPVLWSHCDERPTFPERLSMWSNVN